MEEDKRVREGTRVGRVDNVRVEGNGRKKKIN